MRRFATLITITLLMLVVLAGCSLLEEPPDLILPTPGAGLPPPAESLEGEAIIVDPVSDVVPEVDPVIANLLSQVLQQQLVAYVRNMQNFGTRNSFSATDSETFGIGAARRWIFNELVRVGNGRMQVEFQDFPLAFENLSTVQSNVVATLPGTDPDSGTIVIMAHYDNRPQGIADGVSRSTGANDNGSGIALLLETARLMSSREWNQTIVFLATAAEEQGTVGARFFAENAFLDGENILAVLNYDAIGGRAGIPQHVRLFAENFSQSPVGALGRYYEYIGGLYVPTFPVVILDALDREGRWGDHREFIRVGIPAIRVMESQEDPDLVNSNLDTWDLIDYDYLQQATQLNLAVAANLAGAPGSPPPPLIATMAQPGSYLLTWPVDEGAEGYAISFRPLGSPYYPAFRFVKANRAGNVALTGLDPDTTYAVSMAALDANGRVSHFTPEQLVGPGAGMAETVGQ